MKKGFSLVEILVALAIFGLLSGIVLSSLLGLFRVNQSAGLEARAMVVAKDFLERAVKESSYTASGTSYVLNVPKPAQTQGFSVSLKAAGRMDTSAALTFSSCTGAGSTYTCTVTCNQNNTPVACRLVALEVQLKDRGRTFTFYREWAP